MIRVVIAAHHETERTRLSHVLADTDDIAVVGVASTGRDAVSLAGVTGADVAVVDLSLPDLDGTLLIREVAEECPACRILVLASRPDEDGVAEALEAGAIGHLSADSGPEAMLEGVRSASRGG